MNKGRKNRAIVWIGFCLILVAFSCQNAASKEEGERVVAEVYNKKLKAKEVNAFIPNEISKEDSLNLARSYIEKWVREALLIREAEKKVSKDLAIDQLIKRYRTQLILSNYEKEYIERNLDTTVSVEELQTYYEQNKEQYLLSTTILRVRFMKLNQQVTPKDRDFLQKNWKSSKTSDTRNIQRICKDFGEVCILDEEQWIKLDQLKSIMPPGTINESVIQYNKEFTYKDESFSYFLLIREFVADKELAPFSFIEAQARKFILHRRKLKLLEEMKERLYEQETETNNVKIYID